MKRILVLASGRGSNFQALLEASLRGGLRAEIVALGVSRLDAGARGIAEKYGIPTLVKPSESEILEFVRREKLDAIVLAGYMKILGPELIEGMRDEKGLSRILNIHPSLLPAFPGLDPYSQAFRAGVRETGVTVHLVEREVDAGPILDQRAFRIDHLRTPAEIEARGLALEHELFPRTIDWFVQGEYKIESREGRTYVAHA